MTLLSDNPITSTPVEPDEMIEIEVYADSRDVPPEPTELEVYRPIVGTPRKVPVLPTARARLLAVADLIEASPAEWHQDSWAAELDNPSPGRLINPVIVSAEQSCGAFGCAAGWGIAHTPTVLIQGVLAVLEAEPGWDSARMDSEYWLAAGAVAFGIGPRTADALFSGGFGFTPSVWDAVAEKYRIAEPTFTPAERRQLQAQRMCRALRCLAVMADPGASTFTPSKDRDEAQVRLVLTISKGEDEVR